MADASVGLVRRPRQKRSQDRFELILDAAERLLERLNPEDISSYDIANEARMPPTSVYNLFPDSHHVLAALAERYHGRLRALSNSDPQNFPRWQDLVNYRFDLAKRFCNENVAVRKIMLGVGLSTMMRGCSVDATRELAIISMNEMIDRYGLSEISELAERLTEAIVINDAIWALSYHLHGIITEEYEARAKCARISYLEAMIAKGI